MLKRLFLFMCILLSGAVYAETPDQVVNDVVHEYMTKNDVPGVAVMLVVEGKPTAYYFGYANKDTKKPITKDTIFELGSITKVMTTLLLAQEVDFAKIKLKDPITKYIPTLPATFSGISVRSLATHTGGFPLYAPADVKDRAAWEKYASTWKPERDADKFYEYSNISIGLIGQALETVTHESFNTLYRKKILIPLGMQPIALTVPKKLLDFYAQGYNKQGEPAPQISDGLFPSAGAMKASAEDMGKFLNAAIGMPHTPESIYYPMMMTQTAYLEMGDTEQALGWQVHELDSVKVKALLDPNNATGLDPLPVTEVFAEPVFNGNELIDKTGQTDGFQAYIAVIPNRKTGIVILSNRVTGNKDTMIIGRKILFKTNGIS